MVKYLKMPMLLEAGGRLMYHRFLARSKC